MVYYGAGAYLRGRGLTPAILECMDRSKAQARRLAADSTPRAGIRVQLVAAALLWLVGTSILLVRGVFYIIAPDEYERFGYGIALIALVAVAIGLVKARLILIRYARKAVKRIRTRGHACFFGFFAPELVAVHPRDDGRRDAAAPHAARRLLVGAHLPRHPLRRRRHRPRHRRRGLLARRAGPVVAPGARRRGRGAEDAPADLEAPPA